MDEKEYKVPKGLDDIPDSTKSEDNPLNTTEAEQSQLELATQSSSHDGPNNNPSVESEDEPATADERIMRQITKEKGYELVSFDEGDALNPRNMGKMRKWLIVLILSASSLCV
jgi:hypothetical protein